MISDHLPQTAPWPMASKKRRLLAFYLDYVLFSAAVALVFWALAKADPGVVAPPLWMQVAIFLAVDAALWMAVAWSPGNWALGISRAEVPFVGPTPVVRPDISNAERWWTMLLGALTVLSGAKSASRWTLWHSPAPFMGVPLGSVSSVLLSVVTGVMLCAVGLLILRCRPKAAFAGMALYAMSLVSAGLSYDRLPSCVAAEVAARREFQSVPVRDGEAETMSRWTPMLAVGTPALLLVCLFAAGRRFSRAA